MRYLYSISILLMFSIVNGQKDNEQAVFWDGTSEICYPPLDYDFSDKSNNGEINTDIGFIIQCHIPLRYLSTELPNITHPRRNRDEVGIPQKNTYYYRVNFKKKIIQLYDCETLIETYYINDFTKNKKELNINCSGENGEIFIYFKGRKRPTFRQVKFDEQGELYEVLVQKRIKIFIIRQA
jgi:hypothetical protein